MGIEDGAPAIEEIDRGAILGGGGECESEGESKENANREGVSEVAVARLKRLREAAVDRGRRRCAFNRYPQNVVEFVFIRHV